jgi:hypothetical protein
VHDVGVALDEHEVFDADAGEFADAANVVAAEVDEHEVFGALFFVGEHLFAEADVFGFVARPGTAAGDGAVFDGALFDAD